MRDKKRRKNKDANFSLMFVVFFCFIRNNSFSFLKLINKQKAISQKRPCILNFSLMIFIHLLFWFLIICLSYILIKSHEYLNAINVFLGAIFIEKLQLTYVLFNLSTYHLLINYFSWLLTNNTLITIVGICLTISLSSTFFSICKKWIKIGVFLMIIYWLGR